MVVSLHITLQKESFEIDSSKIDFKVPSSLELVLRERDPTIEKGFDILLHLASENELISRDYRVYFSCDKKDAEEKYQSYLETLKSGNYHLVFDPRSDQVEFRVR